MQSHNFIYTSSTELKDFIDTHSIVDSTSLLIQVFTALDTKEKIQDLIHVVSRLLPNAVIIGSTTDGEIANGKAFEQTTVLNFAQFSDTRLEVAVSTHKEKGYYSGQHIAKTLIKEDTKLLITFADGIHTNGESYLNGINNVKSDMSVAGGLAGDYGAFRQTFVFTKEHILEKGAVAVSLSGKDLYVHHNYNFNWRSIGEELTITKVDGNRVYTIDDRNAFDTYTHYLGEDIIDSLPSVGMGFPLILERNGVQIARAVLGTHEDGSLSFAGNLHEGDKVRFGYGNPRDLLEESEGMFEVVQAQAPQSIFIYSCMARRHFLQDLIEKEISPLEQIAPTSGFFTYGEFFSGEKNELLNQTMTVVAISEGKQERSEQIKSDSIVQKNRPNTAPLNALIHLLDTTNKEVHTQKAISQTQSIFKTLYEESPDGIILMDIEKNCPIECNYEAVKLFGCDSKETFLSLSPRSIFPLYQDDHTLSLSKLKHMKIDILNGGKVQNEWQFKKINGDKIWVDLKFSKINLYDRDVFYVVCRDITERKSLESELLRQKNELFFQANTDILTHLPNRAFFLNELQNSVIECKEKQNKFALLFIDLDRFKDINDSLGHDVGDKMLQVMAKRLKRNLRENNILARFGGDEFVLIIKDVRELNDIIEVIKRILAITKRPVSFDEYTLYTGASIGVSICEKGEVSAKNLLKYADIAMYKAKEDGGNTYHFYCSEMTDLKYQQIMLERDLRRALKNDEFRVYYQPQYDIQSGKVIGVEGLIRWEHPRLGLLLPEHFLDVAKKTGLIIDIDLWVLNKSISDLATWRYKYGIYLDTLALNFTMKQLEHSDIFQNITEILDRHDFQANWLEIEITETEIMKKPDKVITILEQLKDLGTSIAIDDFGTGYSSLSYLNKFPVDKLKIDQSFISNIMKNTESIVIVKTIIELTKSLSINVLAEGVETKEEQEFLYANGCKDVQGYYYSEPLRSDEMKELLVENH